MMNLSDQVRLRMKKVWVRSLISGGFGQWKRALEIRFAFRLANYGAH